VIHTRVGYAGGTTVDPTYKTMGDHTETLQVDFDPSRISYGELLDVFWTSHRPTSPPLSRQYMSAILFHNEEQRRAAEESRDRMAKTFGNVYTRIAPFERFYLAEEYHQKYYEKQGLTQVLQGRR
jgi:peptide-methionine (S)-S-oxide reductase